MSKEMVISASPHETRVAILEEGQLCEYYVEREKEFALVGSIYKGRVTRVLPGMQSAFVEIGLDSDAFLYVSDFLEDIEEFDQIVTTVEDKVQKMEDQGGRVFAPGNATTPAVEPGDVEPVAPPTEGIVESAASSAAETDVEGDDEPSPGNSIADAPAATPSSASHSQQSSYNAPRYDRPRFENRGRDRRDFGRGGNRGGRGGRHGGHGRRGDRGRGGDRRYGSDLPQSKYASPRSYEDRPESAPPSGYTPVILPGESLAKYRDRAPSAPPPATHAEEHTSAGPAVTPHEEHHTEAAPHHKEFTAYSSFGLGPLPGETLSKYQPNEPSAAIRPIELEQADERHRGVEEPEAAQAIDEAEGDAIEAGESTHEAAHDFGLEPTHRSVDITGLSDDQAATLAAHVAEAQIEKIADADGAADEAVDADAAEGEEAEVEIEDEELEEEEAQAEAEGMIAPPELEIGADSEAASEHAHEEAIAAAAASEGALPQSTDAPLPQESQPWKARVRDDFRSRMHHPSRRGGRDRGRRDDRDRGRRPHHGYGHGHHRHQQQRRPQLISELLKQGQEIIVQIAKEPLGKKGARITSHVALPGRYLVYMPTLHHTGVSRKIASAEERSRLRHLVNDAKGTAGGGFIVRTAASSAPPEDVRADVEFLTRTWSEIKARSEQRKAPSLLHRDLNLVERILRDFVNSDFGAVWVDSEEDYTKVVEFMGRFQPGLVNRVKLYTKENPVFEEFGIQQEIDKGLRPKVWLKSGGYIVINHTEALVAIDVNTGKFVGKGSNRLEDTIVRTNLEAVKEIVRQMRLRDLGGIIVIDFIDMEERRNREKVMAALEDALRADRAPSKVLRFNEFGLVAITRKRTKQALERTLCQPCPYCAGSGMVKSIPTLCYEIQAEAKKMAPEMDSGSITLRVNPEISKALKTRESQLIEELERWTKKSVIIQGDPALHWEQYDIF
jgi:Rne/Rng family ribonuclease